MVWIRSQWDRVAAWVLIALAALLLLLGWLGVSHTEYIAEQIPYVVSGGLFGIFLLGVGIMLWLSADLRDEWRKLDRLEQVLAARDEVRVDPPPGVNGSTPKKETLASTAG